MIERRRFKQRKSFQDRLAEFVTRVGEGMSSLPAGSQRKELQQKITNAGVASNLDKWANSPGLRPPEK
jgi:hypothetical protein